MSPRVNTDFFAYSRPRIFGHRGAAGEFPENTIPSFQRAVDAGAVYVELDVHTTRDSEIVVAHDQSLTRTCARDGIIRELTWKELQHSDAGYTFTTDGGKTYPFREKGIRIPRLADVLRSFVGVNYIIEIKQREPSLVAKLLETVDAAGMRNRVLIASEFDEPIREVRALAPEIPTNFPYTDVAEFLQAMAGNRPDYHPAGAALQIPIEYEGWRLVTRESVDFAHRLDVEVHVWTVNEESEIKELLDCGVDGIISDFPSRALAIARSHQA